jgi:DNA (cytosine-5)-methyltransferase 1
MVREQRAPLFVDAFAGCGGLSLGLMQAGLKGLFAIEKDEFAFLTLQQNLVQEQGRYKFSWPKWLPLRATPIETIIDQHRDQLLALRGKIDILAGGPPCQGFSMAGRRLADDPRNRLFHSYVELVELLEPRIVLMENVRGFTVDFGKDNDTLNYSKKLHQLLSERYQVHERLLNLSDFGVPQKRVRYVLIALHPSLGIVDPFVELEARLPSFLRRYNLQIPVSAWAAISDLETTNGTRPSRDSAGFLETVPGAHRTGYQKMLGGVADLGDLRLARHNAGIAKRFAEIIERCHMEGRLNTSIGSEIRNLYGLKKQALRVLDPDKPSPTITSMPDDLLHYREPRTLTVRENARLQSFPDWFKFYGKYTTGGERRRHEVPRFTQVANAVPPLFAHAIGEALLGILSGNCVGQAKEGLTLGRSVERSVKSLELVTQL